MKLSLSHWITRWREPWRNVFWSAFYAFRRENGEDKRWQVGPIGPDDTVFDIGGFEGNWAAAAFAKWNCHVHVFEPHPVFAARLAARFKDVGKITVHGFALGSADGHLDLSDEGDASSAVSASARAVQGQLVDVGRFMADFDADVALAKINIEGGEYDLLPAIHGQGLASRFAQIQVQFHLYQPGDIALRDEIRAGLSQTHDCDWAYPFVWENWSRRP